jgi:hypothetical protein
VEVAATSREIHLPLVQVKSAESLEFPAFKKRCAEERHVPSEVDAADMSSRGLGAHSSREKAAEGQKEPQSLQQADISWLAEKTIESRPTRKEEAIQTCRSNGGREAIKDGPPKSKPEQLDQHREESQLQKAPFILPESQENPKVLSEKSAVGCLIIQDAHTKSGHLGKKSTRAEVRRKCRMIQFTSGKLVQFTSAGKMVQFTSAIKAEDWIHQQECRVGRKIQFRTAFGIRKGRGSAFLSGWPCAPGDQQDNKRGSTDLTQPAVDVQEGHLGRPVGVAVIGHLNETRPDKVRR